MDYTNMSAATMANQGANSTNNLNLVLKEDIAAMVRQAVQEEYMRSSVLSKVFDVMPLTLSATHVPSNKVMQAEGKFYIDEAEDIPLAHMSTLINITATQIEKVEKDPSTLLSLAIGATNALVFGWEIAMLQGEKKFKAHPISKTIRLKSGKIGMSIMESIPKGQQINVEPVEMVNSEPQYGINSYSQGVAKGIALFSSGQNMTRVCYGDYELLVTDQIYSDFFLPIQNEFSTNAGDRIKEIVKDIHASNALEEKTGLFVCKGGPSVNLCMAQAPEVNFLTIDSEGRYIFEVAMKGAVQVVFDSSLIRFNFVEGRRP